MLARHLESGVESVFHVTIGMQALVFLYILFVIKESLVKKEVEEDDTMSLAFVRKTLGAAFCIFGSAQSGTSNLLLSVMFAMGLTMGASSCFFLWAAYSFGWDALDQGVYLVVFSFSRLITMVALFPLLKLFVKPLSS